MKYLPIKEAELSGFSNSADMLILALGAYQRTKEVITAKLEEGIEFCNQIEKGYETGKMEDAGQSRHSENFKYDYECHRTYAVILDLKDKLEKEGFSTEKIIGKFGETKKILEDIVKNNNKGYSNNAIEDIQEFLFKVSLPAYQTSVRMFREKKLGRRQLSLA